MKQRYIYIDYLKIIGLFLVILAHVSPPLFINQLRSCDVPLLVIVSGYLASCTYSGGGNQRGIKEYLWKRFKRLAIPAWIFCCIFLPIRIVFYNVPTFDELIKEFTFQRDSDMLGFMWVIWVYLVCACMIPFISNIKINKKSVSIIMAIYVCFELLSKTKLPENRFMYMSIFTIIPYGCMALLGYNLSKIKKTIYWIIGSFSVFVVIAIGLYLHHGVYVQTDAYKYPAQLYYLSFAVGVSIYLYSFLRNKHLPTNKMLSFISSSSLWIYLWHILALYAVKMFIPDDDKWLFQYVLIIIIAISITYIQNIIIDSLIHKFKIKWLNVFKG